MLVVESIITNEYKEQVVKLTLSNPYFDSSAVRNVSGASVTVDDGTTLIHFFEKEEYPGYYFSEYSFAAIEQKNYELTIDLDAPVNGQNQYKASSRMPEGFKIDSIDCEILELPYFVITDDKEEKDSALLVILYFGEEPANAENYYFSIVSLNSRFITGNPKEYNSKTIPSDNASYAKVDIYRTNAFQNDTIRFRLYTINRDYYRYLNAIKLMDQTGGGIGNLSGPPANAAGNISNGTGLGYFLAAYVSEKAGLAKDKR